MNTRANEHIQVSDLLPLYVSGALGSTQRLVVEKHLPGCAECQADLAMWQAISGEVVAASRSAAAPRGLADRALAEGRRNGALSPSITGRLRHAFRLLRSQMPLVNREIWPSSALVIGLGYIAALVSARSAFIYALAPLVAAGCVSLIYGPENDPAFELSLSTPTSSRQILLARLALVFGYNLGLVLVATLGLLPVLSGQPLLSTLVLSWLAPMTFLSAAALVLSLWVGAPNAISVTYIAWLVQLLVGLMRSPDTGLGLSPEVLRVMTAFQSFWQATGLLLILSAVLFAAAVWLAGHKSQGLLSPA